MAGNRILVVDDETELLDLVKMRLEANGYQVATACDGQEGLEKARTQPPDLIILDLMLPKLNGYEVCRLLKFDQKFQSIPIVMFTARAQDKDERLGMECGADAYIRKPFKAQELLDHIKRLVHSQPA